MAKGFKTAHGHAMTGKPAESRPVKGKGRATPGVIGSDGLTDEERQALVRRKMRSSVISVIVGVILLVVLAVLGIR
jgi:hypothetical protein